MLMSNLKSMSITSILGKFLEYLLTWILYNHCDKFVNIFNRISINLSTIQEKNEEIANRDNLSGLSLYSYQTLMQLIQK